MTYEELHTSLFEKLYAELEAYRRHLMTLPPSEILEHAFEHTIKKDIVSVMEDTDFEEETIKALLFSRHPLDDIFKEYCTRDTQHKDILRDCYEAEAKAVIKRAREKQIERAERRRGNQER